jgi:iodotyrosine deiodinase
MQTRRSIRHFSNETVSPEVVNRCLQVAALAPNGANRQPWTFVVVEDTVLRKQIREAAEAEEREFYSERAPDEWLAALAPLGTDWSKPFLETAPVLICIFAENWKPLSDGTSQKNYYVAESVGIATGFLIAALHYAGLATLTHTPSPMKFLNGILDRPKNEKAFLILVAGYPEPNCKVPVISKRSLDEVVIRR